MFDMFTRAELCPHGVTMASTTDRGYGYKDHQLPRARAFAALPEWSQCVRCGGLMWKHMKDRHGRSALHYDHTADRTGYLGFSCQPCNTRAAALTHPQPWRYTQRHRARQAKGGDAGNGW